MQDDALNGESNGSTVVLLMVRDAYANYVVQTAIDVVPEGAEKRMLIEELRANEVHLVSTISSLHISALIIPTLMVHLSYPSSTQAQLYIC